MAKIDPPFLPQRLFRFRNVGSPDLAKQELGAILQNYLWCSNYIALNDPMEGFYNVSSSLARNPDFELLDEDIRAGIARIGVCCLSDNYNNELMWVHYAGNYTGICIEYSTHELNEGLDDDVHFVRVAYDAELPKLHRREKSSPENSMLKILSHKKSCWFYEREWRLLISSKAQTVPGPLTISAGRAVKGVYFGSRIKPEIRALLQNELKNIGIPMFSMEVQGYEHVWQQV